MQTEVGTAPKSLCTACHTPTGGTGLAVPTLPGDQVKAAACQGQAVQSPGGVFNLKGVLTLFTQNNSNMQRSSKSIVVKQRGGLAALAACPPRARLAPAARRHRSPALCGLPFPTPPVDSLHSCQIYLEQEVST